MERTPKRDGNNPTPQNTDRVSSELAALFDRLENLDQDAYSAIHNPETPEYQLIKEFEEQVGRSWLQYRRERIIEELKSRNQPSDPGYDAVAEAKEGLGSLAKRCFALFEEDGRPTNVEDEATAHEQVEDSRDSTYTERK